MPLPIALTDCDLDSDVCCDGFWAPAEAIRIVGHEALEACLPDEAFEQGPNRFESYVTHGFDADDPIGNSLAVSIADVGVADASTQRPRVVLHEVQYQVRLYETGWPPLEVDGDEIIAVPDRAEMHYSSKHSFSHAESLWRAVTGGIATGTLLKGFKITRVRFGRLKPIEPSTDIVGWRFDVTLTME